jgi:hypothetical protein
MFNKILPMSDYSFELAKGLIPGHNCISKFGDNPNIPTGGVFETIWDGSTVGTYVPPTVARVHAVVAGDVEDAGTELSADDATGGSLTTLIDTDADFVTDTVAAGDLLLNDTKLTYGFITARTDLENLEIAGAMRRADSDLVGRPNESGDAYRVVTDASTGASVFWVSGTDAAKLPIEEFVIMNGTTPVNTALANGDGEYLRQFRAKVFSGGNVGSVNLITSTAASDGTVSCQILAGINQTLMAVYTVPANKTGLLLSWWGSMSKTVATAVSIIHIRVGALDGVGYVKQTRSVANDGAPAFNYSWPVPLVIPPGSDIWMEANSTANLVGVSGGFEVVLF